MTDRNVRRKHAVVSVRGSIIVVGLTLSAGQSSLRPEQTYDLADVLSRAGSYVEEFQRELSGIVAEETYVQEVVPLPRSQGGKGGRARRRLLRSDLLLVRPKGDVTWTQFRDVFEVDGQPVRDREERLVKLFLGDVSSEKQVAQIRAESARYNIGEIARTMNVPLLPLSVLDPSSQPWFRFTIDESSGDERRPQIGFEPVPAAPNFKTSAEVWIVKFEELQGPTLVQTTNGGDIFSHGRFWIEPNTGRVLISEMVVRNPAVRGELVVSYQSEPLLGLLVPIELREWYVDGPGRPRITGVATYSNFRRFQVSTDQTIGPIQ